MHLLKLSHKIKINLSQKRKRRLSKPFKILHMDSRVKCKPWWCPSHTHTHASYNYIVMTKEGLHEYLLFWELTSRRIGRGWLREEGGNFAWDRLMCIDIFHITQHHSTFGNLEPNYYINHCTNAVGLPSIIAWKALKSGATAFLWMQVLGAIVTLAPLRHLGPIVTQFTFIHLMPKIRALCPHMESGRNLEFGNLWFWDRIAQPGCSSGFWRFLMGCFSVSWGNFCVGFLQR